MSGPAAPPPGGRDAPTPARGVPRGGATRVVAWAGTQPASAWAVSEQQRARAVRLDLPGPGQAADAAGPPPGSARLDARWAVEPD